MNETLKESTPVEKNPQTKKQYHTPELRDYGTVRELTLAGGINTLENAGAANVFTGLGA